MRLVLVGMLLLLASSGPVGPGASQAPAAPPVSAEEEELKEFIPSVDVRADNEISFPVDI